MKKRGFILILFTIQSAYFFAQNANQETPVKLKKNSAFIELGGNGFLGSVNYDRFSDPILPALKMSIRIGVAPNTEGGYPLAPLIETNALLGKNTFFFEAGFGLNFFSYKDVNYSKTGTVLSSNIYWAPYKTLRLGCRLQKPNGGFFFRMALTPVIGKNIFTGSGGFWWVGVSVGYSF